MSDDAARSSVNRPLAMFQLTNGRSVCAMGDWDDHERAALVALLRTRPAGMTWAQITAEVGDTGSARSVWDRLRQPSLFALADGAGPDDPLRAAAEDIQKWSESRFRFLTFRDSDYPPQLRDVHQVPPVLFARGELASNESAVSVVGSRSASDAGLRLAQTVASALIERGITVLSGLAAGIDTAAHRAALDLGGRTVAVIGTGINQSYPAANRQLQELIADNGLVVSQFWPDVSPTRKTFPMRNATMSAYGRATIVVEAGEKSGARIQARLAVEHGRPVILTDSVVQGTTWGNELIGKPGVAWARDIDEVISHAVAAVSMGDRVAELLAMTGD